MSSKQAKSFCFVSPDAYSLAFPNQHYNFGGTETRAWTLAHGLAKTHPVAFILRNFGQKKHQSPEGIWFYPHSGYMAEQGFFKTLQKAWRYGMPMALRPFPFPKGDVGGYHVPRKNWAIYEQVNADIYVALGANPLAAEVGAFCRKYGKTYLWLAASTLDFSPQYNPNSYHLNPYNEPNYLCYYASALADVIFVQSEEQQTLIQDHLNRTAPILPNPIDLTKRLPSGESSRTVLWVGKSDSIKNPQPFIELARHFPDVPFMMILNPSQMDLHQEILATAPPNVSIREQVKFEAIEQVFAESNILVNTSILEGFPNTFLQAGKYCLPILSLHVDPNKILSTHGAGVCANGDFESLKAGLARLLNDVSFYEQTSQNSRAYIEANHSLTKVIEILLSNIDSGV